MMYLDRWTTHRVLVGTKASVGMHQQQQQQQPPAALCTRRLALVSDLSDRISVNRLY